MPRVDRYAHAINTLLARHVPVVYSHLRVHGVDSRIYIIEWSVSLPLLKDCLRF